jgi:hypothetical protein
VVAVGFAGNHQKRKVFTVGKYMHAAGAATPPPQKSSLWCRTASPRGTTTNVQHVLA